MFDEDHLEGWCVARHLMSEDLEVPLAEKLLQLLLEIGSEGPWRSKCRCLRGRFTFPPFDGCIKLHSMTGFGKGLEYCWLADEEHSTK